MAASDDVDWTDLCSCTDAYRRAVTQYAAALNDYAQDDTAPADAVYDVMERTARVYEDTCDTVRNVNLDDLLRDTAQQADADQFRGSAAMTDMPDAVDLTDEYRAIDQARHRLDAWATRLEVGRTVETYLTGIGL